jgi:hypothetical protein
MTDLLKSLGDLLKVTPRIGFALAAAGASVVTLLLLDVIGKDPLVLAMAYIPVFGFWVFAAYLARLIVRVALSAIRGWSKRKREAREAAEQAVRDVAEAKANLPLLRGQEAKTVLWLYHRGVTEFRSGRHFDEIEALLRLKVIKKRSGPFEDTTFDVPDYVIAELRERTPPRSKRVRCCSALGQNSASLDGSLRL